MNPLFAAMVSDNEQDRAQCLEWWQSATPGAKLAVLKRITAAYDDPALEVMSRFAQLAFAEMIEKHGA